MKGFISLGTLVIITFLVAVAAILISLFAPRPVFVLYPTKPVVTLIPTVVVSPTVEPTASPSAAVLKKTTVITLPPKTVVVTVTPIK